MKKSKGEKAMSDEADNSSLFGSMKSTLKIHGDIFSTGSWLSDEELIKKHNRRAIHVEEAPETADVGDEPSE